MRTTTLFSIALGATLLTACGARDNADFRDVLPDERLLVNLPEDNAARVGEWSEMYVFTAEVTHGVNGIVGFVLLLVDGVTQYPPSSRAGNTAVWGPFEGDALTAVETQLWVTRNDDGSYTWAFDQRPKNDEAAAWVTVVAGEVDPGATREASRGRFTIDWTTMATMDPTVDAAGLFHADYDIGVDGVSGTVELDDVSWNGGESGDALYSYAQLYGGEGTMDLSVTADFEGSESGADELLVVRSRWLADGQGRGDAYVTGGDLGELVGTVSECWSDHFTTVYYVDNFTPLEEGDAGACAYATAEYNETVEVE